MNYSLILIIVTIVELSGALYWIWNKFGKLVVDTNENIEFLKKELAIRIELVNDIENIKEKLIPFQDLYQKNRELIAIQESLKAERGRVTITQAELESIDARLRELDIIEQEIEASNEETMHEFDILERKKEELIAKQENLRQLLLELEEYLNLSVEFTDANPLLKGVSEESINALESSLTHVEVLLQEISLSNEEYIVIKQRYDALDIEYAQLYEKFSFINISRPNIE